MKSVAFCLVCVLVACAASAQTEPQVYEPGPGVVAPKLLHDVKPHYPPSAVNSGISGTVLLACVVRPDGTASDISVKRSLDPVLDNEAIEALKQWRFTPGSRDGKPVPVMVSVEMSFSTQKKGLLLDSPDVFKPGAGVTLPKVISEARPNYPEEAQARGMHGTVLLSCVVLTDGTVGSLRVNRGIDTALDDEAMKALKQWRFKPGSKDGKAVPVQIDVEISFGLR